MDNAYFLYNKCVLTLVQKKNSSDFLEFLLTNITQLSLIMCLLFPVQMDRAPILILGFSFPLTEKNSEKHNQKGTLRRRSKSKS